MIKVKPSEKGSDNFHVEGDTVFIKEGDYEAAKCALEHFMGKLEDRDKEISSLKSRLKVQEDFVKTLIQEQGEFEKEISSLTAENKRLGKCIRDWNAEHDGIRFEQNEVIAKLANEKAKLESEVCYLKHERTRILKSFDECKSKNKQLKGQLEGSGAWIEGYKSQLQDKSAEIQIYELENRRLESQLQEKDREYLSAMSLIFSLKKTLKTTTTSPIDEPALPKRCKDQVDKALHGQPDFEIRIRDLECQLQDKSREPEKLYRVWSRDVSDAIELEKKLQGKIEDLQGALRINERLVRSLDKALGDQSKEEPTFSPGDVVRLKSGGPLMTIESVLVEPVLGNRAKCRWFDFNTGLEEVGFPLETLKKADSK